MRFCLGVLIVAATVAGSAWAQTPTPSGATPTPFKPASAAQIRALKALYPPQSADDGQPGRADGPYYACLSKRVFFPLSRLLARPTPPTKDRVSALISSAANDAGCSVEGADYIRIKPREMLEAVAVFAEGYRPPQ